MSSILSICHDAQSDRVTIEGVTYSGVLFRDLARLQGRVWLRVSRSTPGGPLLLARPGEELADRFDQQLNEVAPEPGQ